MAQCDVLALLEVHLNVEALRLEMAPLLVEWILEMTSHADMATGGTAMLVRRAAFQHDAVRHVEVLHPRRALAVRLEAGEGRITLIALHLFGMLVAETNAMARRVRGLVVDAQDDPARAMVVMAGDYNVDAPEEAPWRSAGDRGAHRPGPAALRGVAAMMTELHQAHPTRCEMTNGLTLSRIDRIYVSAPGWLLLALVVRVWLHVDPVTLHKRGASDHAPVLAQIMPRARPQGAQRRLPHWVTRTPEYAQRLLAFERAADLRSLCVWERVAQQKMVIHEAADRAMRAINMEGGDVVGAGRASCALWRPAVVARSVSGGVEFVCVLARILGGERQPQGGIAAGANKQKNRLWAADLPGAQMVSQRR